MTDIWQKKREKNVSFFSKRGAFIFNEPKLEILNNHNIVPFLGFVERK